MQWYDSDLMSQAMEKNKDIVKAKLAARLKKRNKAMTEDLSQVHSITQ